MAHNPYIILFQRSLWAFLTLLISLWFSWHLLGKMHFLYDFWYQQIDIKQHIEQYAPQNRYRADFELTTDEQRSQLFAGISQAIQNQGQGLDRLTYQNEYGSIPLLRTPEIVHLQDVANLVTFLNKLLWGLFILWMALSMSLLAKGEKFPNLKQAGLLIVGFCLFVALLLFSYGAEKVFYQLHIWVFPSDHQWFFYYQESLMATLMKAPDLFAYIAAALAVITFIIFFALIQLFSLWQKTPSAAPEK